MTEQPSPQPKEAYAVYCGLIDQAGAQRLAAAITMAQNGGVEQFHIMFQSFGGAVGDGVFIYNLLRSSPLRVSLYNCGCVQSAGVIAFLGANERHTSASATFMLHRASIAPQSAGAVRLGSLTESIDLDDARTEMILRDRVSLRDDHWQAHRYTDLWLSAEAAVEVGVATSIREFAPPVGQQLYNLLS
jgi:ATP-dependent Clp protease protease subunit